MLMAVTKVAVAAELRAELLYNMTRLILLLLEVKVERVVLYLPGVLKGLVVMEAGHKYIATPVVVICQDSLRGLVI
tara:strand:- start:351 stop:578 length:228 start_codon:yes stop_codon:yes gene_type:complete